MEKAASKHINKIAQLAEGQSYVDPIVQPAFGEPDKSTSDVDLTEGGVETLDIEITDDEREELRNVLEIDW